MSISNCPTCCRDFDWEWEDAFDKFGFNDGDGLVMTEHVADALRARGYTVTTEPWGWHNVTITSITSKAGKELIPDGIKRGYDKPRGYLPKRIINLLDAAFPDGEEVSP